MRLQRLVRLGCLAIVFFHGAESKADAPKVLLFDGHHLATMRMKTLDTPDQYKTVLQAIRNDADAMLQEGPWSVMDKAKTPPSGDKHDYYSVGPYWWPDPGKPDGLPYIRRDGEVNPERHDYDSAGLKSMVSAVDKLALGWYFTNDNRYAERAALLLRTWFLDAATKMNPHLQFGQAIPGRTDGRGIGIIDTAQLIRLIDSVGLVQSSEAWSKSDRAKLQAWFRDYLEWLRTSSHGKAEANTKNNHAVWYDAQVASFALFTGDKSTAKQVLQRVGPQRIATQIEPDGRMPLELARTKSFSYTQMNLRGFLYLAQLARHVDVDLWQYRGADGQSIERALDWLEPFVAGRKDWDFPQIASVEPQNARLLYRLAAGHFDKPAYRKLSVSLADPTADLLWPKP